MVKRLGLHFYLVVLFLLLSSGEMFASVPQQKNPVDCVLHYYKSISTYHYKDAYGVRSARARKDDTYENWYENIWSNNVSIEVTGKKLVSEEGGNAVVECTVQSFDALAGNKFRDGTYKMTVHLVKADGAWWIDSFDTKTISYYDIILPDGYVLIHKKAKPVPDDIPLYPGFYFSRPIMMAKLRESDMFSTVAGKNRLKNVTFNDVYKFYRENADKKGWKCGDLADRKYSALFSMTNGKRKVTVWMLLNERGGVDKKLHPEGMAIFIMYERESSIVN